MAVTDDIVATYRGPGRVFRRILAEPPREDRALAYLIAALVVIYIAQWPGMSRAAFFQPAVPMTQRMVAGFLGALAAVPVAYGIAALTHVGLRALTGHGAGYGRRIALFWALLAISPLMLLQGLATGFVGAGPALTVLRGLVFVIFLWFWISGLRTHPSGDAS